MIKITKASAGSGKTFLLAKTYIRLLLASPDKYAYRHILAVTFTNKATDEMKRRILKELDTLATDPSSSDYIEDFRKEFGSDNVIKAKATDCLIKMLHDYGAFSVSTIDSFFQLTLKSFAREIGQFSSYQVELDRKSLVHETVDRILDGLSEEDKPVLEWITDDVLTQIEEKGKFSLETGLYNIAEQLMSVNFATLVQQRNVDVDKVYSKANLSRIRKACKELMKQYEETVSAKAEAVLSAFSSATVPVENTYRGFMTAVQKYVKPDGVIEPPTESFLSRAQGEAKQWFSKANADKYADAAETMLREPVDEFCKMFDAPYSVYSTALHISKQTYGLGIVKELNAGFEELLKEKNVLGIDDSNEILRKIISGTDAPFIYEKLGVRYENFLLDEFQDTSTIQWENFRPLVKESSSSGNNDLIVGDVKQSIYRFRGGDWKLLDAGVKEVFPEADDDEHLTRNFRSLRTVVGFNNRFFEFAVKVLDRQNEFNGIIPKIYSDVEQFSASKDEHDGSVELTFFYKKAKDDDKSAGADKITREVLSSIQKAMESGISPGMITVLVRNNAEGGTIAKYLADNGLSVISDDSLHVKSSITVRRLVSMLTFVSNPEDTIGGYLASELNVVIPEEYHSLADLCESLLRDLRSFDAQSFDVETAYIQAFMDCLMDWTGVSGNDLAGFLKYWKNTNPAISSPSSSGSVKIMTIHKSKGLEAEYVIFPYAEKVTLFKSREAKWCYPVLDDTPLHGVAEAAYQVEFSKKTMKTLYSADYIEERFLQNVDNLNVFYVALTRAKKGLHIISEVSSKLVDTYHKSCATSEVETVPYEFSNFAEMLYWFAHMECSEDGLKFIVPKDEDKDDDKDEDPKETFVQGCMYPFGTIPEKKADVQPIVSSYLSYPLNYQSDKATADSTDDNVLLASDADDVDANDVRIRGRMKFSADSVDFFSDDGKSGVDSSNRIRGTVLHGILSDVKSPDDLDKAVAKAVMSGLITEAQGVQAKKILSEAIESVKDLGWFPEDGKGVSNEVSIISPDGRVFRPDRVVTGESGTCIIDYKFGEESDRYVRQVSRYAGLYKAMDYNDVTSAIWYVSDGKDGVQFVGR